MSFYDSASLVFLPSGGAGKDGKAYSIKPVPEYGNELVTNGGFYTDSDWVKGTGWTISGGTASCDGTQTSTTNLNNTAGNGLVNGKTYRVVYTISGYAGGSIRIKLGNTGYGVYHSANGTYTQDLVAVVTTFPTAQFNADANFVGSIDNVSVKEITTSGDFDFSRGSNLTATRVDSNGLIEKGRENLLENSVWDGVSTDTKPTGWAAQTFSGTGTFDVTATEGQIRFQTLDASSRAYITSPTIATNGIVVVSVYVDEVNTTLPLNNVLKRSANATDLFVYEDGVEINYTDNVQAGKRYSVVFNKTASTTFRFGVGASSGILGDVVLSKPQIEVGLVATEWITSPIGSTGLAGILEDSPRFDYSGGASCPSLLLEPSRTNLIPYSEYFDGPYSVFSTTPIFTTNYGTSPQGVINSTRIQLDAADLFGKSPSLTSSNYVFSVFAKKVGLDEIGLRIDYSGGTMTTKFNLSNGTISSSTSDDADIEDYGNGWYRCWILASSKNIGNYVVTAGGVPADCEIYGLQLEQASYPTSYIPNHSGGSVTRGADSCSGAGTSSTFNDSEGVLYVEASALANDGTSRMIALSDATSANHIRIYPTTTNNRITIAIKSGNVNQYVYHYDGLSDITDTWKVAVRYKLNDFATFVNGVKVDSSSSGSVATGLDELQFNGGASANPFYGKSNQVIVFNSYLSNTDLEILTGTSYESFAAMATALNYTTYE